MPEAHEIPPFDNHIDPEASRQYFQANGTLTPEGKHDETAESVRERIEGIRRLCEEPFTDDESSLRLTNELVFLENSVRRLGKMTIKGQVNGN